MVEAKRHSCQRRAVFSVSIVRGFALCLCTTALSAQVVPPPGIDAAALRTLLAERVGDLSQLTVPADDTAFPQPSLAGGELDPRYVITAEKVRLGKFLFHEPVRSTDIEPALGGVTEFAQTASCSSCHLSHAGTKAGQLFNFGVGGEGRLTMTIDGEFEVVRSQREGAVDSVPTGIVKEGENGETLLDGAADAVDSVPRLSPSVVGLAYNNRLLLDGFAGEPDPEINPDGLPAAEHVVQVASKNHRMFREQHVPLQAIPVYHRLFAEAFPDEFAAFEVSGNADDFINADTIQRAIAAFMRTAMPRETPWDRFLAGDDAALSPSQLYGAYLFASSAASGGADCISCHSGPALNKQLGDESGVLVEENFFNLGLGDHPLRELAREVLEDPTHRDRGREGVSGLAADAFKFRTLTVKQLRNSGPFMHSGELETLRDVVEYFNAGVPADAAAGAAASLSSQFTNPRGPEEVGLGLTEDEVTALVDFLDSGLYDPAFVHYDPTSSTQAFEPTFADLDYGPELETLGAVDGFLPSGAPIGNADPLTMEQTIYVRGEVNGDGSVDVSDPLYLLNFLFIGGDPPRPFVAADTNVDWRIDIADAIYLLTVLFVGEETLAAPYPDPGQLVF